MTAGTLKERVMLTFAINTRFIRKRPAQAALTVLGLSGVALVFLPFDFEVPLEFFIENLDELVWLTLLGPCVVLPFFISAGYLRWLFTGKLSRWEAGVGYALALMVVVLFSIFAIEGWWESGFDEEMHFVASLALGLGAAIWFVIQNLRHGASPTSTALVAMQLAYLPFALFWVAIPIEGLIEGYTSNIGVGAYLAVLAVVVYTAQAALSVRGQSRLWLRLLPLGVVWPGGLTAGFLAWS